MNIMVKEFQFNVNGTPASCYRYTTKRTRRLAGLNMLQDA